MNASEKQLLTRIDQRIVHANKSNHIDERDFFLQCKIILNEKLMLEQDLMLAKSEANMLRSEIRRLEGELWK